MALSRAFVGFSSTDITSYYMMLAWKAHEHIDFNFTDCQLQNEVRSEEENYIKSKCRERLDMAGTYVMLIGADTRSKYKYVKWEAEVAIEKKCRLIGVNLNDNWRRVNQASCPSVLSGVGAIFVPFSPQIVAHALQYWKTPELRSGNWEYNDIQYQSLGYTVSGDTAVRPPKPNPFVNRARPW